MKAKILIIDRNSKLAKKLQGLLQDEGYETTSVSTCSEGLNKASERQPDVVVVDMGNSEEEGFDACMKMKNAKDQKKQKL